VVADRLASQGDVRQRSRLSIDAVASAVARRLRYSDRTGTFPVDALASTVARHIHARADSSDERRIRNNTDSLASSIVARLSRGGRESGRRLPVNEEVDPNAGDQTQSAT
jgi:hypothetical protein